MLTENTDTIIDYRINFFNEQKINESKLFNDVWSMVEFQRIFVPYAWLCYQHVVFLLWIKQKFVWFLVSKNFISHYQVYLTKVWIARHLLAICISRHNIDETCPIIGWYFQQMKHHLRAIEREKKAHKSIIEGFS